MAQATAGEWVADFDDDHDAADSIPIMVSGAEIAIVHGSDQFPCFDEESEGWDRFPGEQKANARLIAASPDLRDVAIAYRNAQGRMLDRWADADDDLKKELWRELHACQEAADKAIAKATVQS